MRIPLIIDTDTGVDDAIAILMALASPGHEVAAITAVNGNVALESVVRNVGIVLDAAGAGPIPYFRGADRPLLSEWHRAESVHGKDGLGDAGFTPSTRRPEPEDAVAALLRLARQRPGTYTLVTLGPLTNIALAAAMDGDFLRRFHRIVVMGGAVRGRGNVTAAAEFNVYADPEAAAMVFTRVPELTLVSWDATLDHTVPWTVWDRLLDGGPLGRTFVRRMYARAADWVRERGYPGQPLPDPLAMAVALDEECATTHRARVDVRWTGEAERGRTVAVDASRSERPPNTRIVTAVDPSRFHAMLERTFRLEHRT